MVMGFIDIIDIPALYILKQILFFLMAFNRG
jgi:hypothetical protein